MTSPIRELTVLPARGKLKQVLKDLTRTAKAFLKDIRGPWAYRTASYSQEGEDAVLARFFGKKKNGFFVDIGSHHPHRFSNTYSFYRRGWSGICVDPLPGSMKRFRRWRPRDIALEMGVSEQASELTYYMFNEPALNTFSQELAQQRNGLNNWRVIEQRKVATRPLAELLAQHMPADIDEIDFLSLDVEGLDLQVLRSNDWGRWRPQIVVAECLDGAISRWHDDPVIHYMREQNYFPFAKTINSVLFLRDAETFSHSVT